MPRILYGYLLRSLAANWVVLVLLLTLIMTCGQLPAVLNRAAEHEVAPDLIVKVLGWMMLANAPLVILLTLMLAIVVTLGRFGADSELTAMSAAGFSPVNVLLATLIVAIPVIALQAVITLKVAPSAFCEAVLVRGQAARNLAMAPIHAGQFLHMGNRTVYAEHVRPDGEMVNIFAASDGNDAQEIVTAARGRIVADSAADRLRLNLYDGRRQTGKPGERRFVTMAFRELSVGIVLPAGTTDCSRPDARHTLDLWNSNGAHERAELNSRLGFIVMTAVLTLIAVVVSRNRPRQSVYSRLPIALGIFAVYQFTATGITAWSARNPALGTLAYWGLHAFAASLATAEFFRGSLQWRNPLFRGSYRAR